MEALKRQRSSQAGNITRIVRKLQRSRDEDPANLNLQLLEKQLASINSANEVYLQWHAAIEEQFEGEINPDEF